MPTGFTTEGNDPNLVSRADSQAKIVAKAKEAGIKGAFKVYYDGRSVASPSDLPETVDMRLVKVSEVYDQA